jgi:hypothetical protein
MKMTDFAGGWHHYAFVKDTDKKWMGIYHNGELVAEGKQTKLSMSSWFPIWFFHIGCASIWPNPPADPKPSERWMGKVDDFRLYDYALSQQEVAWLAGFRNANSPMPFTTAKANFKLSTPPEPNVVNFGDYALLAQQWLSQQWWP